MEANRNVKRFSSIYFLNMVGIGTVGGMFIVLLSVVKQFTPIQVSFIAGIVPLVTMPVAMMFGRLIDKDKMLMKWAWRLQSLHALSIILLLVINDFWLFAIIAMFRNCVAGPASSVTEEYITNISATSGVDYGKIRGVGTIGFGLVGVISPLLIMLVGVRGAIFIGAIVMFITGMMFKNLPEVRLKDDISEVKSKKSLDWGLMKNKEYIQVVLISGAIMGGLSAASLYGTQIMLIEYNCPEALIGTLPLLMTAIEILILFNVHRFNVSRKPYTVLFVGGSFLMIRWIICILAVGYVPIVLATLIHGITSGCGLAVLSQLLRSIVKEKERSSAFLICVTFQMTLVPSIINFIAGIGLEIYGVNAIAIIYALLTGSGLMLALPKVIKEKSV